MKIFIRHQIEVSQNNSLLKLPVPITKPEKALRIFLLWFFKFRNRIGTKLRETSQLYRTRVEHPPISLDRARFNSLGGCGDVRREMIFLKRVDRGFVQPLAAYHGVDFMGHLLDTIPSPLTFSGYHVWLRLSSLFVHLCSTFFMVTRTVAHENIPTVVETFYELLYEILKFWNFVNTVMRPEYRGYIDKI